MQTKYNRFKELKFKIIKKRKEKYKKIKQEEEIRKRKTPQNCKSPMQRQRFITTIKNVTEYTHIRIHPQAKSKQSKKNKVQYIDLVNKGNQKFCLSAQNKTNQSANCKTKLKQGAKWEIKQ